MNIDNCSKKIIREKLKSPFGFKGYYIDELWQCVVSLSCGALTASCPGVQSPLWSDSAIFSKLGPEDSNALMAGLTQRALDALVSSQLERPDILLEKKLPELISSAKELCGKNMQTTFVLNSLVGCDIALWTLWANANGIESFDGIIPPYAKNALSHRSDVLAHIPLISYGVTSEQTRTILADGTAILKIKIGNHLPDAASHEDDMQKMLEWDKHRLTEIHALAKTFTTDMTYNGHVKYYLDANSRYDSLSRISQLLSHARVIGALDDIVLLEEPFAPDSTIDVSQLPVCVAADESAHSLADVRSRLSLGYRAIALKPIAKTLSESFRMAAQADAAGASCFCADLTVNPLLALWNRTFASRLAPLPGMKCGCVEVNGNQNYLNWEQMKNMLPSSIKYTDAINGKFAADECFIPRCPLFKGNSCQ